MYRYMGMNGSMKFILACLQKCIFGGKLRNLMPTQVTDSTILKRFLRQMYFNFSFKLTQIFPFISFTITEALCNVCEEFWYFVLYSFWSVLDLFNQKDRNEVTVLPVQLDFCLKLVINIFLNLLSSVVCCFSITGGDTNNAFYKKILHSCWFNSGNVASQAYHFKF